LSSAEPRWLKWRPEPATRSLTVLDTSTSLGCAAFATRAPMEALVSGLAITHRAVQDLTLARLQSGGLALGEQRLRLGESRLIAQ
jgi:hypothetical protein